MDLHLRELAAADGCNALSLSDPALTPLKTFLRKEAKPLHAANLARTHVLVERGQTKVLAYVTTLCTRVAVEHYKEVLVKDFRYKDYPAIKLARLAVDSSLQGQGIGGQLLDFVIATTRDNIMPLVGCRFLLVDAKHTSRGFYERKGFKPVGSTQSDDAQQATSMILDLQQT